VYFVFRVNLVLVMFNAIPYQTIEAQCRAVRVAGRAVLAIASLSTIQAIFLIAPTPSAHPDGG
jgi:hypothetical protein